MLRVLFWCSKMTVFVVHPFTIWVACILAVCVCTWISWERNWMEQVKEFQMSLPICCKKISLKFDDFLLNLETNQRKKRQYQNIFHHTSENKIYTFTIKTKYYFLRGSFPLVRKMNFFCLIPNDLKCVTEERMDMKNNNKKHLCIPLSGHVRPITVFVPIHPPYLGRLHRDVFTFVSVGRPWGCVECYALTQDVFTHEQFSLKKKRAFKCVHSSK